MINIEHKEDCCGCASCVQKCPSHCLSMEEDSEGFLYPKINKKICIDCGLCEKVCPVINLGLKHEPLAVYAAMTLDESVRVESSSGGIFTVLAEDVINRGGIVFGACFNKNWEVVHSYAENIADLGKFRGSKYVQSKIGNTFRNVESFLKEGRMVLFSGTPCQISGLHRFLRKDYENLLTVDIICHGVPSPGVFRTFLRDEITKAAIGGGKKYVLLPCIPLVTESERLGCNSNGVTIKSISFRDKRKGWKKFGFTLELSKVSAAGETIRFYSQYKRVDKHPYMDGFLKDLYLRPSCYSCPAKHLASGSDITIGDYWGIETLMPQLNDDKGISAVTCNTAKGREVISSIHDRIKLYETHWTDLIQRNPAFLHSAKLTNKRSLFFGDDGRTFEQKIKVLCKVPFSPRRFLVLWSQKIPRPMRTLAKSILKHLGLRK